MNPEPTDRRDAGRAGRLLGRPGPRPDYRKRPQAATSPNEEMVMNLRPLMFPQDDGAETRLRRLVFGTAPEPAVAAALARPLPMPRPEPIRPSWSIRTYSRLAAAALAVVLVGALVAALSGGIVGNRGGNEGPTAIPAAVAQIDATPVALASPAVANNGIVWSLPFEGANVEIGASALADGILYRLIRSDQFTGVQAVDTTTGTEQWRSEQAWTGNGMGADQTGVYVLTEDGVRALDASTGEQTWDTTTLVAPWSLTLSDSRLYLWDGRSELVAIETSNGDVAWQSVATFEATTTEARASQPPVVTASGIAALSGTGLMTFFDLAGNSTGSIGVFEIDSVELAGTADGTVVFAGAMPQGNTADPRPWARKLMVADPATAAVVWQKDYNALVTGLTVTDTMALVLADNPGLAMTEPVRLVDGEGTVTTTDPNPYPEQTSPYIYGYVLDSGQLFQEPEDPTAWNAHGATWIADPGIPPFVALARGTDGPIGISDSAGSASLVPRIPSFRPWSICPGSFRPAS